MTLADMPEGLTPEQKAEWILDNDLTRHSDPVLGSESLSGDFCPTNRVQGTGFDQTYSLEELVTNTPWGKALEEDP